MIYIGADHGGFELKEELKRFLKSKNLKFVDVGAAKLDENDDYPVYAQKVAQAVSKNPEKDCGILLCRSGQGVCIAANKFKGVRAATAWNEQVAKAAKQDDNVNILCLPSDYISAEVAETIVHSWLNAKFSDQPKYLRRINEISNLEK